MPDHILDGVRQHYEATLRAFGPTARGVDWNSPESQRLRFEQLLKVCDPGTAFTLLDYGCGYGALLDHLRACGIGCAYCGYDISEAMVAEARRLHPESEGCTFVTDEGRLPVADYTVASGIFNVRPQIADEPWHEHMLRTVARMARLSLRGFAFNALTVHCDRERMRADLAYADPAFWFQHCVRSFSRHVAVLHDYPLYEFTILVRQTRT
jgi:SAM-dependent methyltransferase